MENLFIASVLGDSLKRADRAQAEAVQEGLQCLLRASVEEVKKEEAVAQLVQLLDALEQEGLADREVIRAGREAIFLCDKLPPLSEQEIGAAALENPFLQEWSVDLMEKVVDAPMLPHDEAFTTLLDLLRQNDAAREGLRLYLQGETLDDASIFGAGRNLQMFMDAYRDVLAEAMAQYDAEKAGA